MSAGNNAHNFVPAGGNLAMGAGLNQPFGAWLFAGFTRGARARGNYGRVHPQQAARWFFF